MLFILEGRDAECQAEQKKRGGERHRGIRKC